MCHLPKTETESTLFSTRFTRFNILNESKNLPMIRKLSVKQKAGREYVIQIHFFLKKSAPGKTTHYEDDAAIL